MLVLNTLVVMWTPFVFSVSWRFQVSCLHMMWSNIVWCLHAPMHLIKTIAWRANVINIWCICLPQWLPSGTNPFSNIFLAALSSLKMNIYRLLRIVFSVIVLPLFKWQLDKKAFLSYKRQNKPSASIQISLSDKIFLKRRNIYHDTHLCQDWRHKKAARK